MSSINVKQTKSMVSLAELADYIDDINAGLPVNEYTASIAVRAAAQQKLMQELHGKNKLLKRDNALLSDRVQEEQRNCDKETNAANRINADLIQSRAKIVDLQKFNASLVQSVADYKDRLLNLRKTLKAHEENKDALNREVNTRNDKLTKQAQEIDEQEEEIRQLHKDINTVEDANSILSQEISARNHQILNLTSDVGLLTDTVEADRIRLEEADNKIISQDTDNRCLSNILDEQIVKIDRQENDIYVLKSQIANIKVHDNKSTEILSNIIAEQKLRIESKDTCIDDLDAVIIDHENTISGLSNDTSIFVLTKKIEEQKTHLRRLRQTISYQSTDHKSEIDQLSKGDNRDQRIKELEAIITGRDKTISRQQDSLDKQGKSIVSDGNKMAEQRDEIARLSAKSNDFLEETVRLKKQLMNRDKDTEATIAELNTALSCHTNLRVEAEDSRDDILDQLKEHRDELDCIIKEVDTDDDRSEGDAPPLIFDIESDPFDLHSMPYGYAPTNLTNPSTTGCKPLEPFTKGMLDDALIAMQNTMEEDILTAKIREKTALMDKIFLSKYFVPGAMTENMPCGEIPMMGTISGRMNHKTTPVDPELKKAFEEREDRIHFRTGEKEIDWDDLIVKMVPKQTAKSVSEKLIESLKSTSLSDIVLKALGNKQRDHYILPVDDKIGIEEGEKCNRPDDLYSTCPGIMQWQEVENCSCHINSPCGQCTGVLLECQECGEVDEGSAFG